MSVDKTVGNSHCGLLHSRETSELEWTVSPEPHDWVGRPSYRCILLIKLIICRVILIIHEYAYEIQNSKIKMFYQEKRCIYFLSLESSRPGSPSLGLCWETLDASWQDELQLCAKYAELSGSLILQQPPDNWRTPASPGPHLLVLGPPSWRFHHFCPSPRWRPRFQHRSLGNLVFSPFVQFPKGGSGAISLPGWLLGILHIA